MSTCVETSIDIALLGCGNVGTAVTRLAARAADRPFTILGALVRDPARPRETPVRPVLTTEPAALLESNPSVVVELLGGTEPARQLVIEALERRIPVVTANKTLLARHGAELRDTSARTGAPVLYEAAVLAGVPFLGTFARRPYAAEASSLTGIANGTSNFILTRCVRDGDRLTSALAEAQRRGYAEPDPRNDVAGIDAAEKLAVLLQHFASLDVHPDAIETRGIDTLSDVQPTHARELGGVIKPIIHADWSSGLEAFVGPAFLPAAHPLAHVDDVENALLLGTARGRLLFQGPGAGPDVTAAAVLDDVREIGAGTVRPPTSTLRSRQPNAPETEWLITLSAPRLPRAADVADLLASYGVFPHRTTQRQRTDGHDTQSLLVWPSSRPQVERALDALRRATDCTATAIRAF
jgi:homoserine dehydrogenase